ncbi:MAG TPA: MMPL family transporter, partial [Solirubrobacteraceae bacterium]|nr:MMPL family transporter [Solirubrobacteraceae bacterium]
MIRVGPIGRLGRYTATHLRVVLIAWLLVAVVLGFFAPRVENALSGAGWETTGSQSVQARKLINRNFHGLSSYGLMTVISSPTKTVRDPSFRAAIAGVERTLHADGAVSTVLAPTAGVSISRDGHTAIVQAGAARDANAMVQAADRLKGKVAALTSAGVRVNLTGAAALWSDFNAANRSAMLRSEVISWPVTLLILLLAFGSLVAAGLPLMLTMVGLMAAAGSLYLATRLMPVSIWAMNFALMFALALGVDYALFVVHRFRGALFGSRLSPVEATAVTMDTAGKAVLLSGVTVLISLSAVMLVPSPAFRSTSLGIMLAVIFVLAATLTLLPAVLTRLGPKVDMLALPWANPGERRSERFAAWGERLWTRPVAYGALALAVLVALAIPVTHLKIAMPSIKVIPTSDSSRRGYEQVTAAMGPGATAPMQIVAPASRAIRVAHVAQRDPGIAGLLPTQTSNGRALVTAIPRQDPSNPAVGATIDRLRAQLPTGSMVGGAVAENHDLQTTLSAKTPVVIGVVLGLGFLLLLIALQAPLLAAMGVLTNLLATAAAFGVAKWIFQDGVLHSLLGLQPQGFLDAWGPVFFFAMIFAISMDYTVFLLSSAKEHWDR